MSELYKRSLGYPFDEDALMREVENGVAGYTPTIEETAFSQQESDLDFSSITIGVHPSFRQEWLEAEIEEWRMHEQLQGALSSSESSELSVLEAELIVERYSQKLAALAMEHPKYTAHVANLLIARLDALAADGHPVDAEMYVDAHALAEEIVTANPDKDAVELTLIIETMVGMVQAQYTHKQLTLAT